MRLNYPKTPIRTVTNTVHGIRITDPYRWLENRRGNSERVENWVRAQSELTEEYLRQIESREVLYKELERLAKLGDIGGFVPKQGGRYFHERRTADQDHAVLFYRDGLQSEDNVAIDPNRFEDKREALSNTSISPDGKYVAVCITVSGDDTAPTHVIDVKTGQSLEFLPPEKIIDMAWKKDGSGFFYSLVPDKKGQPHVYFHQIGTKASDDVPIFGQEFSPERFHELTTSPDGRYMTISVADGFTRNDLYLMDLRTGETRPLALDKDGSFEAVLRDEEIFMKTTYKTPKGRLVRLGLTETDESKWEQTIPESDHALEQTTLIGNSIFAKYLENVSSVVRIYERDGTYIGKLPIEEIGTITGPRGLWNGSEVFFEHQSFARPDTLYRFDTITETLERLDGIDPGFDLNSISVQQVWYRSKDGTQVPMFVVHKKGVAQNGTNPTVLYGYGGFGINVKPTFWDDLYPFLEKGGVFALANIRGGGELGEDWHKAGMREGKAKSFEDFISAGEYLIDSNYTDRERLGIFGGSNGGLLVGACVNRRPELFRAAVCAVPLLDMVRFPVIDKFGKFWVDEYGNPENPEHLENILKYSPYHGVRKQDYPAVMIPTADNDTRVNPAHARKMTAALQSHTTSDYPILMRVDLNAGHGFAKPKSQQIRERADIWAFLFRELGME